MRLLPFLTLLVACTGSSHPVRAPAAQPGPAGYPDGLVEIGPELAPVPFAPGSLAKSFGDGATVTYRIEAAGREPVLQTTEFLRPDRAGVTMRDTTTALDGTPRGEPRTATARWTELESHAHFPRQATTIRESEVDVPAGRFPAFEYRITDPTSGAATTIWFAKTLPGPPVKMIKQVGGTTTLQMVLLSTHRPPAD